MIWIMRKKIRQWPMVIAFLVLVATSGVGILGVVLLAYTAGYTKGNLSSYSQGKLDGYAAACENVQTQARWAINLENDLAKSKQDSAATAAKVTAVANANVHYTCTRTVAKVPSIYEPPLP